MTPGHRILLMLAVCVPFGLLGQPNSEESSVFDEFPVPAESHSLLFYIQRNKNENAIVYEARLNAQGQLDEKDPVEVNWIRYTEGGKKEGLSMLEANIAYGVKHRGTKDGVAHMAFAASNKYPFRVEVMPNGQAEARMMIDGHYARLRHVRIHADESGWWPRIKHVDLLGVDLTTGLPVMERCHP